MNDTDIDIPAFLRRRRSGTQLPDRHEVQRECPLVTVRRNPHSTYHSMVWFFLHTFFYFHKPNYKQISDLINVIMVVGMKIGVAKVGARSRVRLKPFLCGGTRHGVNKTFGPGAGEKCISIC